MITLSYLHAILYLGLSFSLLCGLLYLRFENARKKRFIANFENLLMRALRHRNGAPINLNNHAWRVMIRPENSEDAETQEMPDSPKQP